MDDTLLKTLTSIRDQQLNGNHSIRTVASAPFSTTRDRIWAKRSVGLDHLHDKSSDPERQLLAAVLLRAIRDALTPTVEVSKHDKRTAVSFLQLDEKTPHFESFIGVSGFSYAFCCQALGLCPKRCSTAIRNLKKQIDTERVSFGSIEKFL